MSDECALADAGGRMAARQAWRGLNGGEIVTHVGERSFPSQSVLLLRMRATASPVSPSRLHIRTIISALLIV
jgi:hypothetical protein